MVLACILAIVFCPAAGLFVVGFLFPSCVCCPAAGETCEQCAGNTAPSEYQIDISGVANNSCFSCASVDGTYVVPFTTSSPFPGGCIWEDADIGIGSVCGSTWSITITLGAIAGDYDVRVLVARNGLGTSTGLFEQEYASAQDCHAFSSLSLPYISQSGSDCDLSGATVTITSL
jgi:hypothetical protein